MHWLFIVGFDRLQKRLAATSFRLRFTELMQECRGKLTLVQAGLNTIRTARPLKVLMEHVLALGKRLLMLLFFGEGIR